MLNWRKEKAFLCLMLAILPILLPMVLATDGNSTINISGTETITVGTWDLPWPLDTYKVKLYAIPSFEGENKVSWNLDKNSISPGDSVSSTVALEQGKYNYKMDFRVHVFDKSTSNSIIDETTGTDLGVTNVPGSWSSPSLVVPIVPFEIIGMPAELAIYFGISFSSQYSLTLSADRLQPQIITLEYSSSGTRTETFSKSSGVGAEISLTSAQVEVQGSMTVSVGISVSGIPTPLKKDFASVPIGKWVTRRAQNINMAILKTPITIEASVDKTRVVLGESVTVNGQVSPQASGIPVRVVVGGVNVGATETQADGSFSFDWQPTQTGKTNLLVRSPETKYTILASSSTISVTVDEEPTETSSLGGTELLLIAVIIAALVFITLFTLFLRMRSRKLRF